MKRRLLVIGAGGFLGGRLMQSVNPRFEMIAANRPHCDITDPASVRATFEQARPDIVVLTAALADIDRCQKEPAIAYAINVTGAENVARECARTGARLLFTSSGAVFDGNAERYLESDPLPDGRGSAEPPCVSMRTDAKLLLTESPISIYGQTKAEAERVLREIVPNVVIMRLSLVLGHAPQGGTNALLDKLHAAFQKGDPVSAPIKEYRNAIDAETLVSWILDLAAAPQAAGIFHLGSTDAMSRFEIVSRLAESMGYSKALVRPAGAPDPDRAPRGRCHLLVPARIREFSAVPAPTCAEAIERSVNVAA
jgi:dTDP-4-dehydrorhamnose reductase